MFYLVSLGLKAEHLTVEAVKTIKKCRKVFFDSYTNYSTEEQLRELEKALKKKIIVLNRKDIEENFKPVLRDSKKQNIALLVLGNALTATTHVQLLLEAKRLGVKFSFIPGISITDFLGKAGLDAYRFGRITTIVAPKQNYSPESFYDVIEKNFFSNHHSLCLLEFDAEKNLVLGIPEAIKILEEIEKKRNSGIIKNSLLIGLYAIASKKEKIIPANAEKLKKLRQGIFPQCLIVCAKLTEKEREAVSELVE